MSIVSYRVTKMLEDGEVQTEEASGYPVPCKGDSFDYLHTEVRVGQIIKVEGVHHDGSVEVLPTIGNTHTALAIFEPDPEDAEPADSEGVGAELGG